MATLFTGCSITMTRLESFDTTCSVVAQLQVNGRTDEGVKVRVMRRKFECCEDIHHKTQNADERPWTIELLRDKGCSILK